jgi:hypothetical protein
MLKVKVESGSQVVFLRADRPDIPGFRLTFQRTLRIPDDGKSYPLPPGMGAFPIRRVIDYKGRVPAEWLKTSGIFIPMYQREAMWISFQARPWRPNAVKVAAGKINAVSGRPWDQKLAPPERPSGLRRVLPWGDKEDLQDYMVCPPQPWLDGFNTGEGTIRQFVAMPLGMGYTVEGQVTGKEEHGGLQLIVYEPRAGRFAEAPPPPPPRSRVNTGAQGIAYESALGMAPPMPSAAAPMAGAGPGAVPSAPKKAGREMGLGAGGTMTQKIYPDPHGIETWDEGNYGRVFVHIVNSMMWREITGEEPPGTPVTARAYTQAGYPWYKLYDEEKGDVGPSPVLGQVKSIAQMDAEHGFVGVDDDEPVPVPKSQVVGIPKDEVPDGDW